MKLAIISDITYSRDLLWVSYAFDLFIHKIEWNDFDFYELGRVKWIWDLRSKRDEFCFTYPFRHDFTDWTENKNYFQTISIFHINSDGLNMLRV